MTRPTCCNHDCAQGDKCPLRQSRALSVSERRCLIGLLVLAAAVAMAMLTGARP
jgi:hypothetical protein